jgi:hypothetical protein
MGMVISVEEWDGIGTGRGSENKVFAGFTAIAGHGRLSATIVDRGGAF